MAEDVLATCTKKGLIAHRKAGVTLHLPLVGTETPSSSTPVSISEPPGMHSYGNEAPMLLNISGANQYVCDGLNEAMVRFAARYEYAVTTEDMLARRSRLLFLDARQAAAVAPRVAAILEEETGLPPRLDEFLALAARYLSVP
jgi:glycerol-3-phosphate dehydrogenase